jgi:hypothetical protein
MMQRNIGAVNSALGTEAAGAEFQAAALLAAS